LVVKAEVVRERLGALRATIERLRALRARGSVNDPTFEWAVERGLQLAAQSVLDIGNHVLAGAFADRPAEFAEVAPLLARHGVISRVTETNLQGLAGFRNLLVHDYVHIDFARVHQLLRDRLEDFVAFADELEFWLERQGPSPG
jgi:uncharacterized protein YutE (UPF0331/DUF86 family)